MTIHHIGHRTTENGVAQVECTCGVHLGKLVLFKDRHGHHFCDAYDYAGKLFLFGVTTPTALAGFVGRYPEHAPPPNTSPSLIKAAASNLTEKEARSNAEGNKGQ